jgi:hypothetical protein
MVLLLKNNTTEYQQINKKYELPNLNKVVKVQQENMQLYILFNINRMIPVRQHLKIPA